MSDLTQNENIITGKSQRFVLIVFLLGIFMGAIDSGIVSPARTIIQNSFGVTANVGVWMVTIYTLSYAVSMPIVSKLADKFGRKKFYVLGITLFGIGSLLCALSDYVGVFWFMLLARVIQAAGAGGIMPIANAVIGQSFPEEKRGTALGFVGAVYGVSTILGPTLGSTILDIAGNNSWGWLFMINVPISIIIILLSLKLPNSKGSGGETPIDFFGIFAVAGILLSLLYALTNLDFFNFSETIKNTNVYPFLITFLMFVPIFIVSEKRAKDPVINLNYFKDPQIAFTLLISMIVGIGMMSMIFVPQFSENILRIKEGKGGYFITILSIASGVAAPLSGKFIDKISAKFSLAIGFLFNISGFLYMALVVSKMENPSNIALIFGLVLIGFGVGFTMGAPLNYMMLSYVKPEQAASGLATMSVIRSIGVTLSPSIMIGFVAEGGKEAGTKIQHLLSGVLKPPSGMSAMGSNGAKSAAMAQHMKSAGLKMAKDLQDANVQNVFNKVKHGVENYILPEVLKPVPKFVQGTVKGQTMENLGKLQHQIENVFRDSLNLGFSKMFIATAIISLVGFMFTLLLKSKKKTV